MKVVGAERLKFWMRLDKDEKHVEASGLGILKIWMNKFRLRIKEAGRDLDKNRLKM